MVAAWSGCEGDGCYEEVGVREVRKVVDSVMFGGRSGKCAVTRLTGSSGRVIVMKYVPALSMKRDVRMRKG